MTSDTPSHPTPAFGAVSVSENYERRLAPVLFEPWAEVLIERVGVHAGDEVLDVASGTGVVARLASRYVAETGRVVATDVSGAMLARAAAHPQSGGGAPIEYLEASVQALPVADATLTSFSVNRACSSLLTVPPQRASCVVSCGQAAWWAWRYGRTASVWSRSMTTRRQLSLPDWSRRSQAHSRTRLS